MKLTHIRSLAVVFAASMLVAGSYAQFDKRSNSGSDDKGSRSESRRSSDTRSSSDRRGSESQTSNSTTSRSQGSPTSADRRSSSDSRNQGSTNPFERRSSGSSDSRNQGSTNPFERRSSGSSDSRNQGSPNPFERRTSGSSDSRNQGSTSPFERRSSDPRSQGSNNPVERRNDAPRRDQGTANSGSPANWNGSFNQGVEKRNEGDRRGGGVQNGGQARPNSDRGNQTRSSGERGATVFGGSDHQDRGTRGTNGSPFDRSAHAAPERFQGRSGSVTYNTTRNITNVNITRVQVNNFSRGTVFGNDLSVRVGRAERVRNVPPNVLVYDGCRVGYYHYRRDWRDDWFGYPYYSFDPWAEPGCYASPFYYYVSVPAYIHRSRIVIVASNIHYVGLRPYRWYTPGGQYSRDYTDLDYAVDDLVLAFEDGSRKAINRLVPQNGRVEIWKDGRYSYSLGADDFYDMFTDAVRNSKTSRYEIVSVRENGRQATVVARHSYVDPWNVRTDVYHTYYLDREGSEFVIRGFETSER